MELKDFIKKRRLELGLTLEQVGNYVGVGKSTVKKWESGFISNIGRDKIANLAEILKISPLDLIYDNIESSHDCSISKKNTPNVQPFQVNPQMALLLSNAEQLNTEGLGKLVGYSDDLLLSGKYQKTATKEKAI